MPLRKFWAPYSRVTVDILYIEWRCVFLCYYIPVIIIIIIIPVIIYLLKLPTLVYYIFIYFRIFSTGIYDGVIVTPCRRTSTSVYYIF